MNAPSLFAYLPREQAAALCKLAEETAKSEQKSTAWRAALPVMQGLAGMGVGTAAGYGALKGLEKLTGKQLPSSMLIDAAPVVTGALGLMYNLALAHQMEKMHQAMQPQPPAAPPK